jgi:hypothetical protein
MVFGGWGASRDELVKDTLKVQINDAQRKCNLRVQPGAEGDCMSLELERDRWVCSNGANTQFADEIPC